MAAPGCSAYHFNVTTFPGYLVFTGDMGAFTFSRTRDMFQFHRISWDRDIPIIDYRYWAEKADAVDKHSGISAFNEAHFKEAALREFWNHDWSDKKTRRDEWTLYIRDIIEAGHQSSAEATQAMMDYEYTRWSEYDWGGTKSENIRPFDDFYENGPFTKPSFRLKWACWAIAETIRAYDLGGDRFSRQRAHDQSILRGEK